MKAWTSRIDGFEFSAIHDGFSQHRQFNLRVKHEHRGCEPGWEKQYLINRARFAALKAAELAKEVKARETDLKVWRA